MNTHFYSQRRILFAVMLAAIMSLLAVAPVVPGRPAQDNLKGEKEKPAPLVKELPPSRKRFALLIGVSRYTDKRIAQLVAPENDVDTLAEALVTYAGFPKENVVVLATNKPEEAQPEGYTILEYISTLARLAGEDGLFLLSFSGHGYELDGRAFFLGSNARFVPDLIVLQKTCVSWADMTEIISNANVGQVIMLLDACRNDPRNAKGVAQTNKVTQIYERGINIGKPTSSQRAFVKMLATQRGEPAYEDASRNLGYFMSAVVDGIKGEAADANGMVTLAGLWRYVEAQVPARARLRGTEQKPVAEMSAYNSEQVVLAVTPKKAKREPDMVKLDTPPERAIENPALTELNDWIKTRKSQKIEDYQAFLKKYPNGNLAEEATRRIGELEEAAKPKPPPENKAAPPAPTVVLSKPPDTAPPATKDALHVQRGDELIGRRAFAQAEKEYRQAISLNPNQAMYYGRLGVALYNQGKYKEAEAECRKAIDLDAYRADLFYNLGLTLYRRGKYADAEVAFNKSLKLNPNDAECHASLGLTLALAQRLVEAELEFREAIKLSPNKAVYYNNLGNVLLSQKKYNQAEEAYQAAVKLDPANATYQDNLKAVKSLRH